MNVMLPLIISLIAGLSTIIGCVFIYIKPKNTNFFIGASLAFSATIMLLLSITELIPEGFIYIEQKYNIYLAVFSFIGMILIGNGINILINKKIQKHKEINSNLYRVGVLSMIVLMLHNLPEGILTFLSSIIDMNLGLKISIAIMLHNIPEGIAIAVPIYYATGSKKKAFKSTLISGLSEPLGALLAFLFLYKYISNLMISLILLFVAGLMISISINDIFEEANKHNRKSIVIGIILASIIFIINNLIF